MVRIETIEEVHHILLQITKEFHSICENNNIPYYIAYGSMLGAVRHEGFIPWDDDMDVAVEFCYYQKLVDALKKQLPSKYKLLTRYDKRGAAGGYLKIEDTTTVVVEKVKKKDENTGIFLDIFTLYPATGNTSFFSRYTVVKLLRLIQVNRFFRLKTSNKSILLLRLISKGLFWWLRRYTLINFMEKYIIPKKGEYLCTYSTLYNKKDIIPKKFYSTPLLYKFENCYLFGVAHPHEYLTTLYGNYMELPPEEKRRIHLSDMFYK